MNNVRNPYFDFLRGFAIIMVVGIHSMKGVNSDLSTITSTAYVCLRMLLNCAVPIFLAISGYFIASKYSRRSMDYSALLRKQIPKVYIPCLLFSLPYLVMSMNEAESPYYASLSKFFLCGFSVYYFIALIIQCYILIPFLVKFNKSGGVILSAFISVSSIIIITYLQKVINVDLPLIVYAGPFPTWIVFFVLGVYFSNHKRDYGIIDPLFLIAVGMVLQIIEHKYWLSQGQGALGIKLSSFIFSAGVVWLLFCKRIENSYLSYSESFEFRTVNWIGGMSFGIYLIHCFVILAINHLMPTSGWIVTWILVVCICILTIWMTRLVLSDKILRHIGFN